jgi:uncharacterized protein
MMSIARPEFALHCRSAAGDAVRLRYRPHSSELTDDAGRGLVADTRARRFSSAEAVSPLHPGRKSNKVHTLKIQLGMGCNYKCTYCSQSSLAAEATVSRLADVEAFERELDHLQGVPKRIELWGGEPLVYFAKLRRLVPLLRQRYPGTRISMVTNGSLLDEEILAFIERWDIFIAVSHDGPGQALRGPDPFEDAETASMLKALWDLRGSRGRVSFNVVFTPANADIAATRQWFEDRLEDEGVVTDAEGVVSVYDQHTALGSGRWDAKSYALLRSSIVQGFASGVALQFESIARKAQEFIASLRDQQPSSAWWQKCAMDVPDHLAVDLHGHVMTCQNTGAHHQHHLGEISRLEDVRLDTSTHWSHRECCTHCPVLQLCKGACMYLEGAHFAQTCENEFQYNAAILEGILLRVTGLQLERMEGDIRRPSTRKVVPISVVSA